MPGKWLSRVFIPVFLWLLLCASASYADPINSGATSGSFSDPVLAGTGILNDNTVFFFDNTSTAVYSGFGTNSIRWGSFSGPLAGAPDHSTLTFLPASFTDVTPGTPFRLGTIEFENGTSGGNTLIFGATLTISATLTNGSNVPVTAAVDHLELTGVQNGHSDPALDADFVFFPTIGLSFNVLEGKNATADVMGMIVGDPQLVITNLVSTSPDGFISIGSALFVPEPATFQIVAAGLFALSFAWSRLRSQRNESAVRN